MKIYFDNLDDHQVRLCNDDWQVIRQQSLPVGSGRQTADLLTVLDTLVGSDWSQLRGIAVVVGPGNFTPARTACVIANTLAQATGAELFAVRADSEEWERVERAVPVYLP